MGDCDMSAVEKNTLSDTVIQQIIEAIQPYKAQHPDAEVEARRSNPASVGLRIVDTGFEGVDRIQRENLIWPMLDKLSEDAQSELSMLVLVTPKEKFTSVASLTFQELYRAPSDTN
jgi:hypothetical protein